MKVKRELDTEKLRAEPVWSGFRLLLAEQGEQFFRHWEKVTRSFEEEEIHDLRVASRRLREGLALFAPTLPRKSRKTLGKRVKQVTRMLGEVRNADEALLFFAGLTPKEQGGAERELERLLQSLRRDREAAHHRLQQELSGLDPRPLAEEFAALQTGGNLFNDGETEQFGNLTLFAAQGMVKRGDEVGELVQEALREENGSGQHQLRIALKKLRYRLEIVGPLLRRDYDTLRGRLKDYQDLLGTLHDLDIFNTLVQERVEEGAGRERLLRLLHEKRSALFRSFVSLHREFPVDAIAEKVREAL